MSLARLRGRGRPQILGVLAALALVVPKRFQERIWKAYRRGQEVTKTPSAEYIQVAMEVQAWIAEQKIG